MEEIRNLKGKPNYVVLEQIGKRVIRLIEATYYRIK